MSDMDDRLNTALALRTKLAGEAQRIAGKKEAAEKALSDVEQEIRSKNLDPNTLNQTLTTLTEAYEKAVENFEKDLEAAKQALAPYLESNA